jgi:hypothetical protein
MRWDYQDLNDGEPKRYWSHARGWLRRSGEWYQRRCGVLAIEWSVPCGHCGWSVTFGGGDSGQDLGVTFAIPWLLTVHLTLERVFPVYAFGANFDRGHDRQIGFYFHDWAIWYSVWVGTMASWSRDYPWCRWWRQGSLHFARLLGKQRYTNVVLREHIPVDIPMPEGVYHGTAKVEQATWKRPLWFRKTRVSTWIEVPKGIPFQGKGENSWDCGDDGLFGCGVSGNDVDEAIGHYVASVLHSRRRYGKPSAESIQKALA